MRTNYRRDYRPLPQVVVPLIILPLRLERYTETIYSAVLVERLPFLVAVRWQKSAKRWIYIHRRTTPKGYLT